QLHRGIGLGAVVDAAQPLQAAVVETLDAEADPVHPGGAVVLEAAVFGGAGVGLERHLQAGREPQPGAGALQEAVDLRRWKQAWRAAAEEHAVHGAAPGQRQVVVEVGQQRVDVAVERQRPARLVRVEVAVRALAHAPGQVHVQRQRRWAQHRPGGASSAGSMSTRGCAARTAAAISRNSCDGPSKPPNEWSISRCRRRRPSVRFMWITRPETSALRLRWKSSYASSSIPAMDRLRQRCQVETPANRSTPASGSTTTRCQAIAKAMAPATAVQMAPRVTASRGEPPSATMKIPTNTAAARARPVMPSGRLHRVR